MSSLATIERKSLLYRSKVEYGGWTINHALGCSHGCKYPCYAMMLAKRTGRIHSYEEWVKPQLVENALELLDAELARRTARDIDSVHLCFTTEPFMFDRSNGALVEEMANASLAIIRRLNEASIPVTVLTKGYYPTTLLDAFSDLHPANQYGISLVSTSDDFVERWEPGAAPAQRRIESLTALAGRGASTWVSMEPYPTPNLDSGSSDVVGLLDKVSFVDKIVFGRWNYRGEVGRYDREHGFYLVAAQKVSEWCRQNGKNLHIKRGTPLSTPFTVDVLKR